MENKVVNLKINVDSATAKTELNNIKKGTDNVGESSKVLSSKLDSMTGGALSGFKSMTSGLFGVAGGFKGVGAAIALSGLGLLVLVISSITAAFKNSEAGQNKFAKIMGIIGSVTGNLIDTLSNLGEKLIYVFENPKKALTEFGNLIKQNIINRFTGMLELFPAIGKAMKLVFEGEFSKAGEVAFNAVSKVTTGIENTTGKLKGLVKGTKEYVNEIAREGKVASKIADDRAKADTLERDLINKKAVAENKINLLREKSIQLDKFSAAERSAFLKEALKISDDISLQEIKVAKLRANAKTEENKLSGSTKQDLNEEAELRANIIKIDSNRLSEQRRIATTIQSLQKEDLAGIKSIANEKQKTKDDENKLTISEAKKVSDELKAIEKKSLEDALAIKKNLELSLESPAQKELREYNEKKAILLANNLDTILLDNEHKENLKKLDETYWASESDKSIARDVKEKANSDARIKIIELEKKAKIDATDAVGNTLSAMADLLGKETAAGKAAAVASATINTFSSAQKAYDATVGIPFVGPVLAPINAGLAIAAGIKNVKSILAVKVPSGGGGGSAPSGGSAGATAPAIPNFNVVGASSTNQLAQTMAERNQQPIKTYVVSGDISTAQSLERNIISSASIG
tara:strand:+ start:40 stop:1941 length:1902 start_codon:yes stop_codon:yes gene_type:complete